MTTSVPCSSTLRLRTGAISVLANKICQRNGRRPDILEVFWMSFGYVWLFLDMFGCLWKFVSGDTNFMSVIVVSPL
jgi:hypothetical protein